MKLTCDRCGATLMLDHDVRYKVRIEVSAAYDPMEISEDDLAGDHRAEMRRLIGKLAQADARSVEESVYATREFEICPACQRAFLRDPLGKPGGEPATD